MSVIGAGGQNCELASIALLGGWAGVLVWSRSVYDTAETSDADQLRLHATWFAHIGLVVLTTLVLVASVRRSEANARRLFSIACAAHEREADAKRSLAAERAAMRSKLSAVSQSHDALYFLLFRAPRHLESTSPLPMGDPRVEMLAPPAGRIVPMGADGHPRRVFGAVLRKSGPDWHAAERAAVRIREPHYTLQEFYVDCRKAFPEIDLYTVTSEQPRGAAAAGGGGMSSGVSAEDEYMRTLGALFAVYWLARIGIDGECGFSFGVDSQWRPIAPEVYEAKSSLSADETRRLHFYEHADWESMQRLLFKSGAMMLERDGEVVVNEERMIAILALTAIHDVMKVEALLPTVTAKHAPYAGFGAGETIHDHDVALSYLIDHFPYCLPSYAGLSPEQRSALTFCASKISFNHGWMVQAEAPPGALFSRFKATMATAGAAPRDVAFYFLHWLTDLAGAVPSPLAGSEKFTLQFPLPVLHAFVRSFGVVEQLAKHSETHVYETYLEGAWEEISEHCQDSEGRPLGPVPTGHTSIGLMRLVVQAQLPTLQLAVAHAFTQQTTPSDQRVLSDELCRTGLPQRFQRAHASPEGGPAILVYYAPAFLRRQPPASARDALVLLAEVYRRARQLWPLGPLPASIDAASVTVRIDQMKELALEEIHRVVDEGTHAWVLVRGNQREATVECHPRARLAELQHMGALVLSFGGGGGAADASSPPRRRSMNARSHFTFSGHSAWVSTSDLDAWGAGTPRSSTYEGKRGQALSPEAMRRQEQLQAHRLKRQRASIDAGTPTRSISRGWKWPWSASAARAEPETPLDA